MITKFYSLSKIKSQKLKIGILFCFILSCSSTMLFAQTYNYEETIRYDNGVNDLNFGPAAGKLTTVAHYHPGNSLEKYKGMLLHQVKLYIYQTPVNLEIKIFDEGTSTSPGNILYSKVVPAEKLSQEWVTVDLDSPVEITGKDLWIGYSVTNKPYTGCIGRDSGPGNKGYGDWICEDGVTWKPMSTKLSFWDSNWNIAGILKAPVINQKDVSIKEIIKPSSKAKLSANEEITIQIKNYGIETQTSIPYTVTWADKQYDGVYNGSLASLETVDITLPVTADLSEYGVYNIQTCTNLPGDARPDLNCISKEVENRVPQLCVEDLYKEKCNYDRISFWNLSNISIDDISCPEDGNPYYNYLNKEHILEVGKTYFVSVETTNSNLYFNLWIDFDDNLEFTPEELILADAHGDLSKTIYTFEFTIPEDAPIGSHVMRMRTNFSIPVKDACEQYSTGVAMDFMANITAKGSGILDDTAQENIKVYPIPALDNINIESDIQISEVQIFDLLGKSMYNKKEFNSNIISINVSSLASGVYAMKIINQNGKLITKKITIKN